MRKLDGAVEEVRRQTAIKLTGPRQAGVPSQHQVAVSRCGCAEDRERFSDEILEKKWDSKTSGRDSHTPNSRQRRGQKAAHELGHPVPVRPPKSRVTGMQDAAIKDEDTDTTNSSPSMTPRKHQPCGQIHHG